MSHCILLVADQPYQARLLAKVGEKLLSEGFEVHLAFTDWYMFLYQADLLKAFVSRGIKVHTMEEAFESWQREEVGNLFEMKQALEVWEADNCLERDLRTLELTNNFVYANEREYFGLPVTPDWKLRILFDTVMWVENLLNHLNVDVVLAIENCTLANNLIFTKAQKNGIPHLAAMNSRIDSRWVVREDFGFGMNAKTLDRVKKSQDDSLAKNYAFQYVNGFQKHGVGAYRSISQVQSEKEASSGFLRVFAREAINLAANILHRALSTFSRRKFIRLEQNFTRLSIWEVRALWRKTMEALFSKNFELYAEPENEKYFLWCLHYRPEGSVLTASQGEDEIDLLERVARLLPEGVRLLVKEHPLMFGFRDSDFYDHIAQLRNVSTVSPEVPTKSLILKSQGVLGIAGTVLIEAQMLGRPAWTLGRPEFEPFIHGSGFEGLSSFLSGSTIPTEQECQDQILAYITFVFSNSTEDDTWIGDHIIPFELQDVNANVSRLTNEVKSRL